jgi:nucleotide-binding universal stress UspA family protein
MRMFERILLPLDGSETAEIAIPYGEELARRLGSEVILYHTHGPEHQQQHMHQMYLDRLAETVEHNIRKGRPKGIEVKVTTKVEPGEPAENICNLLDKNKVDLIIMTAVSASGLKVGKMLGSVTDHVCRTVPIPVMLIRPQSVQRIEGKKRLINRILIPLDGSDLSKLALPVGEDFAAKLKVPATLFQMSHVIIPYATDPIGNIPPIYYLELSESEEKRVRAEIIELEKKLREKNLTVTHSVTRGTDAAHEMIEVGKKVDADLVVMATHGRSGLRRWVFGNVAEKVLRHGEIPLLLVHARAG